MRPVEPQGAQARFYAVDVVKAVAVRDHRDTVIEQQAGTFDPGFAGIEATVAIIVGEGGSGGAIGIGVTNRVLMLENSYYSVITPEGCAAILYKDAAEAPRAASALKIDAASLDQFGIVDEVISEPFGGAHHDPAQTAKTLDYALQKHLNDLRAPTPEQIVDTRYERFRHMGVYEEAGVVHN